jgi:hypothetical protein
MEFVVLTFEQEAINKVPSRMTMLEGNMDWLINTRFLQTKERGFIFRMRK